MPYAVKRYSAKRPPIARLYMTTEVRGVHFYERPAVDSLIVGKLYGHSLFHGSPVVNGRWIRRLKSVAGPGGGFAWHGVVKEMV